MAAGLLVHWRLPETVASGRFELDFAGIVPPREVRSVFLPAAMAGVAAFGVSGVLGSVGPGMLGRCSASPRRRRAARFWPRSL